MADIPRLIQQWIDFNDSRPRAERTPLTTFIPWGNGAEDKSQAGYHASNLPGAMTAQQLAAMLGVNQGTARDCMSGRHGKMWGFKVQNIWFITRVNAIEVLYQRMEKE